MTLTYAAAEKAARKFVNSARHSQWSLKDVEAALPQGYRLAPEATDDAFMPLTIKNAVMAFRHYAIRIG